MGQRQPRLGGFARRYGTPDLDVHRAQERVSAFTYGNILVLGAIATAKPSYVEDGHAVVLVLATTVTTYLAHVVAHLVGGAIGRAERPPHDTRDDLRDAVPILSSGSLPALILLVAWLADLDPDVLLPLAAASVVVRLAGMGLLVARLSGHPPSGRQLWAGIVLAGISLVIVGLKVAFLH